MSNIIMEDNGMTVGMQSLWEQGQFFDLNIRIEDSNFKVHKVVMMANSDFFKGMFTGNVKRSPNGGVKLEGVSAVAMDKLVTLMYTNEMNLTEETAAEVLAGAMFLQIPRAVKCCIEFIIRSMEIDTCHDALLLFKSHNLIEAAEKVSLYMKENVWKMVKTVDHSKLTLKELHFFVENWQGSELELFYFISNWVDANPEAREGHLDDLLRRVRYGLMTPEELEGIQELPCYHCKPNTWSYLVKEATNYQNLPVNLKVMYQSEQAKVRNAPTFALFTGEKSKFGGYMYDTRDGCLIEDENLRTPEGYFRCQGEVDINNYLVICTGTRRFREPESWYIYDPRTNIWFRMADLPRGMESESAALTGSNPSVLTHDNRYLYAVRESIERYDFITNSWSGLSRMPEVLQFFGAGVCQNGLYVCGGRKLPAPFQTHPKNESQGSSESVEDYESSNEESEDSSQEEEEEPVERNPAPGPEYVTRMDRLDLSTLKWESKAPMLMNHTRHSLHTMRMSGEDVLCIFRSVTKMEYYKPSVDQWSSFSFMLNVPLAVQPDRDGWVHSGQKRWCKGRTHYLVDINLEKKFGREKNACVIVTYPEEGREAILKFLYEYEGQFQQLSQTRSLNGLVNEESDLIYRCGGGEEKQNCHPTVACFPPQTKY